MTETHQGASKPSDDPDESSSGATDATDTTLDRLADELRRVAGARSPKALRDAHLPTLSTCLDHPDDPDRRLDDLRRLITDGLAGIDDAQFRSAAEALFAYGDHRWTPLRQRGELASAPFNCSFDAYRRARRRTGTSLLDETVRQLAVSVSALAGPTSADDSGPSVEPTPDAPLADPPAPPPDPPATAPVDPPKSTGRGRLVTTGIVVVVLLALVGGGLLLTRRGGSGTHEAAAASTSTPTPTTSAPARPRTCTHPVGEITSASFAAYRVPFQTQVQQLTPPGQPQPCGAEPVTQWEKLVIEHLTLNGKGAGVLVATDPDHVMLMSDAEFNSYHQIGGKDGNQAQNLAGLPRRRATSKSGKVWLIITDHGAMASEGVDQPGFYLGGPVWTRWQAKGEDLGEMGMPASNPLNNAVGYYQDFSKGRLTLSYSGSLDFHGVTDPAASLPADYKGQILRHDDATTWYVDQKGVRHWIPDGDTWFCLHDKGAEELPHVPGYASASLPLGPPATCTSGGRSPRG